MKVLYVTMQYGAGYTQGTERYLTLLADGLTRSGGQAVFLAGDPLGRRSAAAPGQPVPDAARLVHYPTTGWMAVRGIDPTLLRSVLVSERPDLIHLANPAHIGVGIVEAAAALDIPVVITVVDYWWLCPKQTLWHYRRNACDGRVHWSECLCCIAAERDEGWHRLHRVPLLNRVALPVLFFGRWAAGGVPPAEIVRWTRRRSILTDVLRQAAAVILLSHAAERLIGPFVPAERRDTIFNGLEPHWFAGACPPRDPRTAAPLTLGYAGALALHKGTHLLLQAVRELGWRDVRVLIAGQGSDAYTARLRELARGLNVEFLGGVPPPAMPALLDSLDALVFTSVWPENMPNVVLEACARRRPVLASRVPGVAEMLRDERGLFDVGSAASLAECLKRWRESDRPLTPPCVGTAQEMFDRTLAVYRRVLATATSSAT